MITELSSNLLTLFSLIIDALSHQLHYITVLTVTFTSLQIKTSLLLKL